MELEAGTWSSADPAIPVLLPDRSVGKVRPNDDWQASYPAKLFARGLSAGLSGVLWYGLRDEPADVQQGLLDSAGQPKKGFEALRQAPPRPRAGPLPRRPGSTGGPSGAPRGSP